MFSRHNFQYGFCLRLYLILQAGSSIAQITGKERAGNCILIILENINQQIVDDQVIHRSTIEYQSLTFFWKICS
jgi:hypothetical protein